MRAGTKQREQKEDDDKGLYSTVVRIIVRNPTYVLEPCKWKSYWYIHELNDKYL